MAIPQEVWLGFASGVSDSEPRAIEAGLENVLGVIAPIVRPRVERIDGIDHWQHKCARVTGLSEPLRRRLDLTAFWQEVRFGLMHFALERGRKLSETSAAVILTLDADLLSPQTWLFGATEAIDQSVQSVQLSVLSVARFREQAVQPLASQSVSRLARHEFGHAIGLVPASRRTHVVQKIGLHCTNVCSMRQGMSLAEFTSLSREEDSRGIVFCPECLDDLGL